MCPPTGLSHHSSCGISQAASFLRVKTIKSQTKTASFVCTDTSTACTESQWPFVFSSNSFIPFAGFRASDGDPFHPVPLYFATMPGVLPSQFDCCSVAEWHVLDGGVAGII